jgi:hypothetical protein
MPTWSIKNLRERRDLEGGFETREDAEARLRELVRANPTLRGRLVIDRRDIEGPTVVIA